MWVGLDFAWEENLKKWVESKGEGWRGELKGWVCESGSGRLGLSQTWNLLLQNWVPPPSSTQVYFDVCACLCVCFGLSFVTLYANQHFSWNFSLLVMPIKPEWIFIIVSKSTFLSKTFTLLVICTKPNKNFVIFCSFKSTFILQNLFSSSYADQSQLIFWLGSSSYDQNWL